MTAADSITTQVAEVICQCGKRMLNTGLTNLFKTLVISGATAHSIKILGNHRVIVGRVGEPIQVYCSLVAGIGSHGEPDLSPATSVELR